jgi:hypothetical protein
MMINLGDTAQQDSKRLSQTASLGRELAELVDEWSVTTNDPKAQEIASVMIGKARELLRATTALAEAAKTA